jgi:hypothetical protein
MSKATTFDTKGGRSALARVLAVMAALALALVWTPAASEASQTPAFNDRKPVEIVNSTGLRADVMWASQETNQGLLLWPNNQSLSQEFNLIRVPRVSGDGGQWYVLQARHSGQCLTLDQNVPTWGNGTRVVQNPYCGTDWTANQWRLRTVGLDCGPGCTTSAIGNTVVNRYTGRCLDAAAPSGRPAAEATIQQWDCVRDLGAWNVANQRFDFRNVP